MTTEAKSQADDAIDEAVSAARNMKDDAGNLIERFHSDVVESAQDKPLTTLGVVAIVGFLIGAVWKS